MLRTSKGDSESEQENKEEQCPAVEILQLSTCRPGFEPQSCCSLIGWIEGSWSYSQNNTTYLTGPLRLKLNHAFSDMSTKVEKDSPVLLISPGI